MLELLNERRIKRIILLSDGRTAIVEVPVENMESDFENIYVDRREPRWVLAQSGRSHVAVLLLAVRRSLWAELPKAVGKTSGCCTGVVGAAAGPTPVADVPRWHGRGLRGADRPLAVLPVQRAIC
jgi:hypothetical protein